MTPAQVRAQVASGTTHPIYLLESDDAPSRYDLAQAFLALVDEGLHAFNTAAFHAREAGNAGDRDQMLSAILGAAEHADVAGIVMDFIGPLTAAERQAILGDTATRFYGLQE